MPAKNIILWLFYLTFGLLLISLPFSNYMMSVTQFTLVGIFILDGIKKAEYDDFIRKYNVTGIIFLFLPNTLLWITRSLGRKFRSFFHKENAPAWIFSSIYLMHLLGLFLTTDFHYALKDLRIKFPLFLLPLILSTTGNIDRKAFRYFTLLFIASVFTGTIISTFVFLNGTIHDYREISVFISHIRFSLLIDLAVLQSFYLVLKRNTDPAGLKVTLFFAGLWMIAFLIIFAFMTGLAILLATAAILIFVNAMSRPGWKLKIATVGVLAVFFLTTGFYLRNVARDVYRINPIDLKSLEKVTALGNYYWNDTLSPQIENGNYVWIYVSKNEMRDAWNQRSQYEFEGRDEAGQELQYTLIRFLTSKGYRKDAGGVEKLTDEEVAMVENGIASIVYAEKSPLYVRIYKTFWEYREYQITRNASGHSLMQRMEYWRTAAAIVKDNSSWWVGIGTGDLDKAFQEQYDKMDSKLDKAFRWRTHNQFLAIFVTFGSVGLAWFVFCLIFPAARLRKFSDFYFLSFFIVFILSMFTEDTLETQVGVTQFAFFTSFYLFLRKFIDIF